MRRSDNHPLDPRTKHGPFSIRWSGRLMSQMEGPYRLIAYVQGGDCTIMLRGKTVLQGSADTPHWFSSAELTLPFDWHPLEITFASESPDSVFSLFWTGPDFRLEPISGRFNRPATDENTVDHTETPHRRERSIRMLPTGCSVGH